MGSVHRSCVWLLVLQACGLVSGETLYMDSNSVCGSTRTVGPNSIIIEPRGLGGIANPPANCILQLESAFQESGYGFEIVLESAAFVDCGLTLNIFDGFGVGGSYIRQFGCSTRSSTNQFYSNYRAITLQLIRSRYQYVFGSHFSLNITEYKYENADVVTVRTENAGVVTVLTSNLSAGVIIGIVLGFVVLVAFAILLGWCYKTGHLGFGDKYPPAPYGHAYPVGAYPYPGMGGGPPGAPFQLAGQAQSFMEATPTRQQKMAFAMTTHSQGSQDDSLQAPYGDGNHPGMPGCTSTSYNRAGNQALVPAGTVLDDPQVPPPGTSLVRYDDDPLTGLHDMTYRTVQQIQASGGEPAFMSPSHGAVHYTPNAIQYASQTPERANSGFYTAGTPHVRTIPGSPTPVLHEAPIRN